MDDPVAIPSSTMMTTRPEGSTASLRASVELPPPAENFLLGADFFAQVLVGRYRSTDPSGRRLPHPPHQWRAPAALAPEFPDQHHIQIAAQRFGNDARHRHGAAGDPQHERMLSPIGGKPVRKLRRRLLTVLEVHDLDSLPT
jgi:hypothetical protein